MILQVYGVKGRSPLASVAKIPDSFAVDYMHAILEGMFACMNACLCAYSTLQNY